MSRLVRRIFAVLAIILVALALVTLDVLSHFGVFRKLEPNFAGTCESLPLSGSAEDIQIDRNAGIAYLSVLDRRGQIEGRDVRGTVLNLAIDSRPYSTTPALIDAPPDFRPHGMSLYTAPDGSQHLFVLSHPPGAPHTVEVFLRNADGHFAHTETIHNPLLFSPNAIVAVGERQFYVANDSGARGKFERTTEILFRRALSNIAYYDGTTMRVVDDALGAGTGIAASADGGRVYLSEFSAHRVRTYSRDSATGDLDVLEAIDVYSAPDNLNVAEDGAIWVAAHPSELKVIQHFRNARKLAPTQVLRIAADPATSPRIGEVYLNDGSEISAGSVAAVAGNHLLIGAITDPKILICRLPGTP